MSQGVRCVCQSFDACEDDRMRQCCASGKVKVSGG